MRQLDFFQSSEPIDTAFKTVPMDKKKRKFKNGSQNAKVLDYFKSKPDRGFTAWQITEALWLPKKRITSIRRAITTLTGSGYLVKTNETILEREGMNNYLYKLK